MSSAASENSTASPHPSNTIKAEKDGYVPLTTRLMAWWEGVGVDEINDLKASSVAIKVDQKKQRDPMDWDEHRLAVAQSIWGESFLKPGGGPFTKEILKNAKVSSKDTVLDLTAGMCGSAMTLARQHNLWMEAFEQNEVISTKAHNMLVTRGMAEKIKLKQQQLFDMKLPSNKYDLIYSMENLYKESAKIKVLEEVKEGLKKNGRFIFSDFIIDDTIEHDSKNNAFSNFNLWTTDKYLEALRKAELNVFGHQDMSNQYLKHINHAWYELVKKLEGSNHTSEFIDALMHEGQLWLSRHKTIQSKQVRLVRFHCFTTH